MRFDPTLLLKPRVDGKSRVCVRQCFYSVPVRFAGGRIDVRLGAERVEAIDGKSVVADHARAVAKGTEVLVLDHYLEVFRIKPGAFPGAPPWPGPGPAALSPPPTTSFGRRHGAS